MADVVNSTHICKGFFAISLKPLYLLMFHGQSFFCHFARPPESPVFTGLSAFSPKYAVFNVSRGQFWGTRSQNHTPKQTFFSPFIPYIYRGAILQKSEFFLPWMLGVKDFTLLLWCQTNAPNGVAMRHQHRRGK